jgi:hypothetical protein
MAHYAFRLAVLWTLAGVASDAGAIVMRHDRASARYEALAAGFPAAVAVTPRGGAGTLIDAEWVLTAAHVADLVTAGAKLTLAGNGEATLRSIHRFPGGAPGRDDIALLRLAAPVRGVAPVPVYRGDAELGAIMTFVGWGGSGDGRAGPTMRDGRLRAATNRVERVGPQHLEFHFDPPATATDLEGISGPGDSGGPALLAVEGRLFVAGISSGQDSRAQGREGVYGVREFYTRVAAYAEWIDGVVKSAAAGAGSAGSPEEADLLFRAGSWTAVADAYERLAADHPDNGQYAFRHGWAQLQLERMVEAVPALRRAASLGFQAPMALFLAARAELAQGHPEQAWRDLEAAVAAGFSRPDLLTESASLAALRADPRFAGVVRAAEVNRAPCVHGDVPDLSFWVGGWEVWMGGQRVATSRVEVSEGGCVVTETYRQSGAEARLVLFWHAGEERWRGLYVDEKGGIGEYRAERSAPHELLLQGVFWQRGRGAADYRLRIARGERDGIVAVVGESRVPPTAEWSGRYELEYRAVAPPVG